MSTFYDWVTVAIFAGLIVLFLQRSSNGESKDPMWRYLVASLGCAVTNYLGNEGYHLAAIAVLIGTAAYILFVLRPFPIENSK